MDASFQFLNLKNLPQVEKLYLDYKKDPGSVDTTWRHFFKGLDCAEELFQTTEGGEAVFQLIETYRIYGHLLAENNPIEPEKRLHTSFASKMRLQSLDLKHFKLSLEAVYPTFGVLKEKKAPLRKIFDVLQKTYAGRIGVEYKGLANPDLEEWIRSKIEPYFPIQLTDVERQSILTTLSHSEIFEAFLNTKYPGQKRFSIEGAETLVPMLWSMIDLATDQGSQEIVMGMSHRGRLNVLANVAQKPYSVIFHEFEEEYIPFSFEGTGDVKYHKGFSSNIKLNSKKTIHFHLAANPSHLESVNAVVLGQTLAKQVLKQDKDKKKIIPILIHGDAALSGQGVIYETMQFSNVDGYRIGGSIHVVVNNQIGFTTLPSEGRSTTHCTDIAKTFGCPVFHVNTEDVEACVYVSKLAFEIRQKFHCDVFIDLISYRKYGHNEGDEPAFTQPVQYKLIRSKQSIREIYRNQLIEKGIVESANAAKLEQEFKDILTSEMERAKEYSQKPLRPEKMLGTVWEEFKQASNDEIFQPIKTSVSFEILEKITKSYCRVPENFSIHKKLEKWLLMRLEKIKQEKSSKIVDWSLAEMLAMGSILLDKVPIRLAGQDSKRGTFNHRHSVWIDQQTSSQYSPLNHIEADQAHFDVFNSTLSEFAALGFDYGYSLSYPNALILWEAQFGDFSNGAQVIIDQYITTAEQKWNRYSSLTLLLPHGYEGQGPEHSSARIERFLQLTGDENIQVVNPTTPAQYFHLLRRQALRKLKKPLIVLTPKSLLRHPECINSIHDFTEGQFEEILDDVEPSYDAKRLIFCSGRIFYDLISQRKKKKRKDIALLRLEQLYPFHVEKMKALIAKYTKFQDCFWVQEEPSNMGAWDYIRPILQSIFEKKCEIKCVARKRSASPSTGSHHVHKQQLEEILDQAFS